MIAASLPVIAGVREGQETIRGIGFKADSQGSIISRVSRSWRQHLTATDIASKGAGD
jgi:hypothetical protein